jgi:hypothetical protein
MLPVICFRCERNHPGAHVRKGRAIKVAGDEHTLCFMAVSNPLRESELGAGGRARGSRLPFRAQACRTGRAAETRNCGRATRVMPTQGGAGLLGRGGPELLGCCAPDACYCCPGGGRLRPVGAPSGATGSSSPRFADKITMSTRRFFMRFSGVSLGARGRNSA